MRTMVIFLALCGCFSSSAFAQNQCLVLDGSGTADSMTVSSANGLNSVTAFTLESWARYDGPGGVTGFVLDMGVLSVRWSLNDGCGFSETWSPNQFTQPGDYFRPNPWDDGAWHHWAYSDDGSSALFYLDGVLFDIQPSLGLSWNMNGRPIEIGRRIATHDHLWKGRIDELRIWNVARTAGEIQAAMSLELNTEPGLVSSYHFEGNGLDACGVNNAVAVGTPTFGTFDPGAISGFAYPGSGDDLVLSTGINDPATSYASVKTANAGDLLRVAFYSPLDTYSWTVPFLGCQVFPQGTPPFQPVDYPEVRLDFAQNVYYQILTIYDGQGGPLGGGLLPPGGMSFAFIIPPNLAGLSLMIQGFSLSPSVTTGNTWFTATDGMEILFL